MLQLLELGAMEEYFTPISQRRERGVFFCRFPDYHPGWMPLFQRLFDEARKNGAVVDGKVENPDRRQLDFYEERMGKGFSMAAPAIEAALQTWLPRLTKNQRAALAAPLSEELAALQKSGKTENMCKNAYIKFFCWLYYKFEQLVLKTGGDHPPKLLYVGTVGDYQLRLLSILARAGCDVALLLPGGEEEYRKADPALARSTRLRNPKPAPYPAGFSLKTLQAPAPPKKQAAPAPNPPPKMNIPPRPGAAPSAPPKTAAPKPAAPAAVPLFRPEKPKTTVQINTWLTGDLMEDVLTAPEKRGKEPNTAYKLFVRIRGAEDKSTYPNELVRLKLKLEGAGRPVLLLEGGIPMPTTEEIGKIHRESQGDVQRLLLQLVQQLQFTSNREVERHAQRAFLDILAEGEESIQKRTNRAVSALCLLRRYLPLLFPKGKAEPMPALIHYGPCRNGTEATLFRLLARLPADILLICPDRSLPDQLADPLLFDRDYENSLPLGEYPKELDSVRFGTVAYRAEQELNTLLYENSGMYRNHQFKKAVPITIQTTYEEIAILWKQEAKYRPNFETLSDRVMVPVICAKVSGVPGGQVDAYWNAIARLKGEDVYFSDRVPAFPKYGPNQMIKHAPTFLKNGKLQVSKIKAHPAYPYAFLREDMQDYMMDKLQVLIDSRLITGTFQTGAEYSIVSSALNLDKPLLRMLQKYDFTKMIPKLLLLGTGEEQYSLEEGITIAYLNLLGFDIALFVPTGYQVVERYYTKPLFVEQQAGDYVYDLRPPDWNRVTSGGRSIAEILFRRGN